jgi:hypothetical protein
MHVLRVRVMVFNATFNNISAISWRSILLEWGTGVPGENHRPVSSHWLTLSHSAVLSTPRHERYMYFGEICYTYSAYKNVPPTPVYMILFLNERWSFSFDAFPFPPRTKECDMPFFFRICLWWYLITYKDTEWRVYLTEPEWTIDCILPIKPCKWVNMQLCLHFHCYRW